MGRTRSGLAAPPNHGLAQPKPGRILPRAPIEPEEKERGTADERLKQERRVDVREVSPVCSLFARIFSLSPSASLRAAAIFSWMSTADMLLDVLR